MKKVPLGQCIGCGEMKTKKEVTRALRAPEGEIILDMMGRKNGHGTYVCSTMEYLKKAIKGKGLERSFKMVIPREVYEALGKEMEQPGE